MKKSFLLPSILMLAVTLHAQSKTTKPAVKKVLAASSATVLKNNTDSISYAFGIFVGENLKGLGVENLNYAALNKAISQSLKKETTYFNIEQAKTVLNGVAQKKSVQTAAIEKEKGRLFLEKNKSRPGVLQTASGLQYEVLVKGTGPVPTNADTIIANYKGALLNGKEFDNSYKRGEPLTIPVAGVIPGWTEALTMMPVGSKWKLYIPSSIGYGDYGNETIPGGSTLVFEIELLGISNKKSQ